MKTFRWKVKLGVDVASAPSVGEVRFGDGYSQRTSTELDADLRMYSVTLPVSREEVTALESFPTEHGGWKTFPRVLPYDYGRVKVTCAEWSSWAGILRVGLSAEFEQVVS